MMQERYQCETEEFVLIGKPHVDRQVILTRSNRITFFLYTLYIDQ